MLTVATPVQNCTTNATRPKREIKGIQIEKLEETPKKMPAFYSIMKSNLIENTTEEKLLFTIAAKKPYLVIN